MRKSALLNFHDLNEIMKKPMWARLAETNHTTGDLGLAAWNVDIPPCQSDLQTPCCWVLPIYHMIQNSLQAE